MQAEAIVFLKKSNQAPDWQLQVAVVRSDSFQKRERQILDEEATAKKDPEYWNERARLYRQVKKGSQAEHAYKKGLGVAPYATRLYAGKELSSSRSCLLRQYVDFLKKEDRTKEAFSLLTKEVQIAPYDSWSAGAAAGELLSDSFRGRFDQSEPLLWKWIAKQPTWTTRGVVPNNAGRALDSLARRSREEHPDPSVRAKGTPSSAFLQRVEAMAKDAGPSHAFYCAHLLLSSQLGPPDPKKAIPWLRRVLENKEISARFRRVATDMLIDAYLNTGDLQNAEKSLRKQKTELSINTHRYLEKIAIAAAKKGNAAMAIRNWREVSKTSLCDRAHRDLTQQLRNLDLDKQIDAYYREVKKKLPEFRE